MLSTAESANGVVRCSFPLPQVSFPAFSLSPACGGARTRTKPYPRASMAICSTCRSIPFRDFGKQTTLDEIQSHHILFDTLKPISKVVIPKRSRWIKYQYQADEVDRRTFDGCGLCAIFASAIKRGLCDRAARVDVQAPGVLCVKNCHPWIQLRQQTRAVTIQIWLGIAEPQEQLVLISVCALFGTNVQRPRRQL